MFKTLTFEEIFDSQMESDNIDKSICEFFIYMKNFEEFILNSLNNRFFNNININVSIYEKLTHKIIKNVKILNDNVETFINLLDIQENILVVEYFKNVYFVFKIENNIDELFKKISDFIEEQKKVYIELFKNNLERIKSFKSLNNLFYYDYRCENNLQFSINYRKLYLNSQKDTDYAIQNNLNNRFAIYHTRKDVYLKYNSVTEFQNIPMFETSKTIQEAHENSDIFKVPPIELLNLYQKQYNCDINFKIFQLKVFND